MTWRYLTTDGEDATPDVVAKVSYFFRLQFFLSKLILWLNDKWKKSLGRDHSNMMNYPIFPGSLVKHHPTQQR